MWSTTQTSVKSFSYWVFLENVFQRCWFSIMLTVEVVLYSAVALFCIIIRWKVIQLALHQHLYTMSWKKQQHKDRICCRAAVQDLLAVARCIEQVDTSIWRILTSDMTFFSFTWGAVSMLSVFKDEILCYQTTEYIKTKPSLRSARWSTNVCLLWSLTNFQSSNHSKTRL